MTTTERKKKTKKGQGTEQKQQNASNTIIAAGTYEGTVAGYEVVNGRRLELAFDSPTHEGSVRSVASCTKGKACILVSTGYDELLQLHDFGTRTTGTGHVRTPADYGTPTVVTFAPPSHCLVGFSESSGSIIIYKRRDWSVQHVFPKGHEGGVSALAVHPSGKLAISGGVRDGKLKVWDLERGRLAFSGTGVPVARTHVEGKKRYDAVEWIVWKCSATNDGGDCYAFCYGSHITIRDVATGSDLLDVELPSKVNQVCFMDGEKGLFVAAACDDGSLPVLAVHAANGESEERPAIMAIEPAAAISGIERYKCIQSVSEYTVATATSTGVVSIMDLQGAVNMILTSMENDEDEDDDGLETDPPASDKDEELELAVDILDSKLLGRASRITCLSVWTNPDTSSKKNKKENVDESPPTKEIIVSEVQEPVPEPPGKSLQPFHSRHGPVTVLEDADVQKARALVSKAKKIQKKKTKRKHGLKKSKA